MTIGGLIRRGARQRGFSLGRYPHTGSVDDHLAEVLTHLNVRHVLDVGANDGAYVQRLRQAVGYRGAVSSFEPATETFDRLAARASADPRWNVYSWALGDTTSGMTLYRSAMSELNSLHPASTYGREVFGVDQSSSEMVEVRRLDDIWRDLMTDDSHPGAVFLKTDTQGHDLAVLRGAEGVLNLVAGLQMEVPLQAIYEDMPSLVEVFAQLQEHGYYCTGIFPVSRGPGLRLVEVDIVALRAR